MYVAVTGCIADVRLAPHAGTGIHSGCAVILEDMKFWVWRVQTGEWKVERVFG
jgi:hypothetical protein